MTRRTHAPTPATAPLADLPSPPENASPADPRRTARRVLAAGLAAGLATTAGTLALHTADPVGPDHVSRSAASLSASDAVAPSPLVVSRPATTPRASRSAARTALAPVPTRQVTTTVPVGSSFSGEASWYGGSFQGRRTASGERFDTNQLTAASKTLPFGTKLRVCRKQRCVVVRINDRGPYVGGRILDLSRAAKDVLGYDGVGYVTATPVARKTITVVDQQALARQRAARAAEVAAQARAARARRTAAAHREAVARRAAAARTQALAAERENADRGPFGDLTTLPPVPTSTAAGLVLAGSGGLLRLRRRRDGS